MYACALPRKLRSRTSLRAPASQQQRKRAWSACGRRHVTQAHPAARPWRRKSAPVGPRCWRARFDARMPRASSTTLATVTKHAEPAARLCTRIAGRVSAREAPTPLFERVDRPKPCTNVIASSQPRRAAQCRRAARRGALTHLARRCGPVWARRLRVRHGCGAVLPVKAAGRACALGSRASAG
jgi:hypothetical protein